MTKMGPIANKVCCLKPRTAERTGDRLRAAPAAISYAFDSQSKFQSSAEVKSPRFAQGRQRLHAKAPGHQLEGGAGFVAVESMWRFESWRLRTDLS